MRIRRQMVLSTVAVVIAGGNSLVAQVTTGSLVGKLTDANGKSIVGAKVVLESPALFNPRVLVTDGNGEYRALLLPVGDYTVRVSAPGMLGKTAHSVRVGVGQNLQLPFVLNAIKETASTTVEVVSDFAQAAKADDKISANFSAEKLLQLPTGGGPSFAGALGATPGVTGTWDASSTKIRGGETNQVMYRVNGINVKDDTGGGALYSPLPDSIEDVQVVLTALNARFGSVSGGSVNVVTKSGSNDFEGTIRTEFSRPSWSSDQMRSPDQNAVNRPETFNHKTDVTISGPIIKDRLWFYLGTRFQPSESVTGQMGERMQGVVVDAAGNPVVNNGSPVLRDWSYVRQHMTVGNTYGAVPNLDALLLGGPGNGYSVNNYMGAAGDTTYGNREYKKYEGKLTGAITDAHLLSVTYLYEKTTQGAMSGERGTGILGTVTPASVGSTDINTKGWTVNWNGTLASNWTVETRYSHMERDQTDVPRHAGSETGPSIWYFLQSDDRYMKLRGTPNQWMGDRYLWQNVGDPNAMTGYNQPEKRGNNTYSVNFTTFQDFKGQHQIDFGVQRDESIWNFGRSRPGSSAVWSSGGYMNAAGKTLYPVFYRTPQNNGVVPVNRNGYQGGATAGTNPTDLIENTITDPGLAANGGLGNIWGMANRWSDGWRLNGDIYTQWWSANAVGAHLEKAWVHSGDENNHTDAFYVNDSWTINNNWNVMVGARYNKMTLSVYGKDARDMNVFEPRAMVKFNPDGDNKNVYSLSYAKLSQAYSDKIANYFRGNEWTIMSMQHWIGANLDSAIAQPGFDSVRAQNDVPAAGTHNGYTYDGVTPMNGLRFVDYKTLTDPANYSKTGWFRDQSQTVQINDLTTPYALEWNLGFQHNFSQGWFKLNFVQRDYKDRILGYAWAPLTDFGAGNNMYIKSPIPGSTETLMTWKDFYPNSKKGQTYRSLEFSFDRQLTSRWDLTGSFTMAKATGWNEEEYYTNQTIRRDILDPQEAAAATPNTILENSKYGYLAVTYIQPVGKGNVSLSARLNYNNNGGNGSLAWQKNYMDNSKFAAYTTANNIYNDHDPNGIGWVSKNDGWGASRNNMFYNVYYGSAGQYRDSLDTFQTDVKLNADVPVYKKIHLIGYISVNNIFNQFQLTNMWTAMKGMHNSMSGNYAGVNGRGYQVFDGGHVYGQAANALNSSQLYADYNWGNAGRQITNVSIGLKF